MSTEEKPRQKISNESFIEVYEGCNTAQEVSDKTGLTLGGVYSKANKLFNTYGIKLKDFERKESNIQERGLAVLAKARGISIEELKSQIAATTP